MCVHGFLISQLNICMSIKSFIHFLSALNMSIHSFIVKIIQLFVGLIKFFVPKNITNFKFNP